MWETLTGCDYFGENSDDFSCGVIAANGLFYLLLAWWNGDMTWRGVVTVSPLVMTRLYVTAAVVVLRLLSPLVLQNC